MKTSTGETIEIDPSLKKVLYKADWTNHDKSVTGIPGIQVLLRVDESTYDPVRDFFKTRGGKAMGKDHPIAWINTLNNGRFFINIHFLFSFIFIIMALI